MSKKIKTIDINALEWFDKVNGNSYFAGTCTINYGLKDEKTFKMPFEYGYGDYYIEAARQILEKEGYIKNVSLWRLKEKGVIIRTNKHTKCKKSELKNI